MPMKWTAYKKWTNSWKGTISPKIETRRNKSYKYNRPTTVMKFYQQFKKKKKPPNKTSLQPDGFIDESYQHLKS